ncbi:MAG: hypothetical protein RL220_1810 [Bacteroidota bacterium]
MCHQNNQTPTTMKTLSMCIGILISFMSMAQSNVRISMFSPAAHEVRLTNFGNVSQNIGTHFLCNFPDYRQINTLEVISGSLNLTAGSSVTVIYPDAWLSHGEIGYYINNLFSTASSMKDYVEWGEGFHTRETLAVSNGFWSAGDFVSGLPPYQFTGTGSDFGLSFWSSVVAGCTYPEADNYNPSATIDDGTCALNISCVGDLNADGTVGTTDLLVFVGAFGSDCP